jgi:phosphoglycolate phosphatase-like HAD superfamily hydrolase
MSIPNRLVLFDIDGTLVRTDGLGRESARAALIRVFGTDGGLDDYEVSGCTERQVIHDLLSGAGLSETEIEAGFDRVFEALEIEMRARLSQHNVHPCPGGRELVEALAARDDVLVGLVTGNYKPAAFIKLERAGYAGDRFRVGAYGHECAERADLVALAVSRAEALAGRQFRGKRVVIVGDTPADVACSRPLSARSIAVATGGFPVETLTACRPDYLFSDLTDTHSLLEAILA